MHDDLVTECTICGSSQLLKLAPYRCKHELFSACSLYQCESCQFTFANPMPDDKSLAQYNSNYFANAHNGLPQDRLSIAFHSAINKLRAIYVDKNISLNDAPKVLEIGGATGHFAQYWKSKKPKTDYYMVETDTNCYASLQHLNIQFVEALDQLPEELEFDLIVMSHVLEHTNSPLSFLSAISKKLKSGGALFIEVPCSDWKFKTEDEPHLLFFDKKPMQLLLEKSGFKQQICSYHGDLIENLSSTSKMSTFFNKVRMRLLKYGVTFPFSTAKGDLSFIDDPLERAVVKPFYAHVERKTASAWLRTIAIKL